VAKSAKSPKKKTASKKAAKSTKKATTKKPVASSSPSSITRSLTPAKGGEYTIEELAEKEGVHTKTIRLWITEGKIPARHAVKDGGIRGKHYIPKKGYKRPAGTTKVG
jgi:hypothetical protein